MKGLAFAYDPDGYWIEIVARDKGAGHPEPYNLGQTMLRIKDVEKSLDFYTGEGGIGMTKVGTLNSSTLDEPSRPPTGGHSAFIHLPHTSKEPRNMW